VLLMRTEKGDVAAMGNICPHRFASLSDGRFEAGVVECPYHGLRFNMSGQCIHNPHGDGVIAERARVPSYPLVERYGALWIWPGKAEVADPAAIPDLSFLDAVPPSERGSAYLRPKANYQLLCDNILDLSHIDFIHRTSLGTAGELTSAKARARLRNDVVTVEWSFAGKGMVKERGIRAYDEGQFRFIVTWYPAGVMVLSIESTPVGSDVATTARNAVHIMTPETDRSTHYFFEGGVPERKQLVEASLKIFEEEDSAMLEQVQKNMGNRDFWALEPLILANDSGAVLARRTLQRLIRLENGEQAEAA